MNIDELIKREPGEKVVMFLRRHPIVLVADVLLLIVLAVIPFGLYIFIDRVWPLVLIGKMSRPSLILLTSAYYLYLWLFCLTSFIDYYLDCWVVTSSRILDVEQHGLFARTVSELDIGKIQDVTSEERGVLAFIFNYGYVYVQTAGETERFDFEQVHKPHEVRKQILLLVEEENQRHQAQAAQAIKKAADVPPAK